MINAEIDENVFFLLRQRVSSRMSNKRFAHTIGVEQAAIRLGRILLPNKVNDLRIAALLHDVSKEMGISQQLRYIDKCELVKKEGSVPEQALHSFSGVAVILDDFPEFATPETLEAVMHHTLGSPKMSLFAMIIFVSDFIEEGRPYFDSAKIRKNLYYALESSSDYNDKLHSFYHSMIECIDSTVQSVYDRGLVVDERTIKTKIAIQSLI